jgi:hypothetical protein
MFCKKGSIRRGKKKGSAGVWKYIKGGMGKL